MVQDIQDALVANNMSTAHAAKTHAATPACCLEDLNQREQQIFPAEAVALPLGTWALHEHLRDRDVI